MPIDPMPAGCERKFLDLVVDDIETDGAFSGYASLFGRADTGRDVVERGAFARSLRERGAAGIRMLFQHDPAQPIGVWRDLREDGRGLFVSGRLTNGAARAEEVKRLMSSGALDGLSIGFRTVRARRDARTGLRHILEADLWEISVVTFPMLPEARVERVKGLRRGRLPTVRAFENWLRRDAGLTRGQAHTVIAKGFASLMRERDAARGTKTGLAETIRRAATLFKDKETHP